MHKPGVWHQCMGGCHQGDGLTQKQFHTVTTSWFMVCVRAFPALTHRAACRTLNCPQYMGLNPTAHLMPDSPPMLEGKLAGEVVVRSILETSLTALQISSPHKPLHSA